MHEEALVWGARRITWEQMDAYCAYAAGQLKAFGFKPGDRVAICAPTSPEYIIVIQGLWRLGVVVCPINPKLPAGQVAAYAVAVRAVLFLTTVLLKQNLSMVPVRTLVLNEIVNFDARHGFNVQVKPWHARQDQEVTVIATSGTGGQPQPALHTWGNHFYSALGSQAQIPLSGADRWLLCLPLFHVSGIAILVRALIARAAVVLPVEEDFGVTIERRGVTHVSLVAAQMQRLLATAGGVAALKKVNYILLGGSAIAPSIIAASQQHGLHVLTSYGLTEMSSQVATARAGEAATVLPYAQLKISSQGEILVRGPTLFSGYIQAGRLRLPLTPQGWFATGDLGALDAQGRLTVLGRRDNMFICGGENIYPEEIEKVLLTIEGINQVMVVPKEDAEFGFRPVAFIEQASSASLRVDQMVGILQEHLPSYKVPVMFFPWPGEGPQSGLKLNRRDLQNMLGKTAKLP